MGKRTGRRLDDGEASSSRGARSEKGSKNRNRPADAFTISDLSAEFAVTTRTIRFYESEGLISPTRRGSKRIYSRRDRRRLILILRGKNLGFSLEEIAEYLALYDADPSGVTQLKHLIGKVDAAIDELNRKRTDLDRTLRELKDIQAKARELLG
ncbi:MAG TPA: MerR family DNA-binding transcriptional regulator [Hyphomicrobiaceae bacterium]|nr:MerR family DNA-binding transcriptional regulator [Hyphomicrobiaceae bacterium]